MDLSHWDLIDEFTLFEAACLAAGKEPRNIENIENHPDACVIYEAMNKACMSAWMNAHLYFGPGSEIVLQPDDLPSTALLKAIDRCKRTDCDLELFSESDNPVISRQTLASWFSIKKFLPSYSFVASNSQAKEEAEKLLSTKERTTLYTIIGLLAKEAKIDYSQPSAAAAVIKAAADLAGIDIGQRTIEEHLKKIPDALERRGNSRA